MAEKLSNIAILPQPAAGDLVYVVQDLGGGVYVSRSSLVNALLQSQTNLAHLTLQTSTGTPPAGTVYFYVKTDGNIYLKDENGVETLAGGGVEVNDLTAAVTWANIPDVNVPQSAVTQHQAALSITESQILDLQSYLTAEANDLTAAVVWANIPDANVPESAVTQHQGALALPVNQLTDVANAIPADRHVLIYDGIVDNRYENRLLVEADISDLGSYLTAEVNDLTAAVVWANIPDANVPQTAVTQHQAALTITESQISDLGAYLTDAPSDGNEYVRLNGAWSISTGGGGGITEIVQDTSPQLGGDLDPNGNDFLFDGFPTARATRTVWKNKNASDTIIHIVPGSTGTAALLELGSNNNMAGDASTFYIATDAFETAISTSAEGAGTATDLIIYTDDAEAVAFSATDQSATFSGNVTMTGALNRVSAATPLLSLFDTDGGASANAEIRMGWNGVTQILFGDVYNDGGVFQQTAFQIEPGGMYVSGTRLVEEGDNISLLTNDSGFLTDAPSDGTQYVRRNGAWEANSGGAEVNDLTAAVTWANIPDVNVPQSAVTQHQTALAITESQITDLGAYLTDAPSDGNTYGRNNGAWAIIAGGGGGIDNVVEDLTPQLGGDLDVNGQKLVTVTNGDMVFETNGTGAIELLSATVDIGDPGLESGSVLVNGLSFPASVKINRFGGTTAGELILHRHSSVDDSHIVFSRATSNDQTHSDVANNTSLGDLVFTGWHTDSYYQGAWIRVNVDGMPGTSDMPSKITFATSADGSAVPAAALTLRADKTAEFAGGITATSAATVTFGNFVFDTDQTVGVGQDNYVLTYDNGTGLISLKAATGGGGGISNVVEDLTPQLGGNLDCNLFTIQNVAADITIDNGFGLLADGGAHLKTGSGPSWVMQAGNSTATALILQSDLGVNLAALAQPVSGKIRSAFQDASGDLGVSINHDDYTVNFTELSATPSTPATGIISIYAKNDGLVYALDDTGSEFSLSVLGNRPNTIAVDDLSPANSLVVASDGTLTVQTANYEDLVTSDDDIPNRKFVLDNRTASFAELTDEELDAPSAADIAAFDIAPYYATTRALGSEYQWQMNEPSGTNIADAIGGQDGTTGGTLTLGQAGPFDVGDAILWGTGGYIEVPHIADFSSSTGDMSFLVWMKTTATSGTRTIISQGTAAATNGNYQLRLISGTTVEFTYTNTSNQQILYQQSVAGINDDNWHLIGVSHTWGGSNCKIYVDGVEYSPSPTGGSSSTAPKTEVGPFVIGARASNKVFNFVGSLCGVEALFGQRLTAAEHAKAYSARSGLERWISKDPLETLAPAENGFPNRTDSNMTWTNGTRTFEISPASTSFDFWSGSQKFTKDAAQSSVITDTEGLWFFYFDTSGDLQATQTFADTIITRDAFAALVYWDAVNDEAVTFAEERHSNEMNSLTHLYNHHTFGTRYASGLQPGDIIVNGSGDLDTHAQLSITAGVIWDEDIEISLPQLTAPAAIPIIYRSGANGDWRKIAATNFIVTTTGTGRAAYNNPDGGGAGVWGLTEVTNNDFLNMHLVATNDLIGDGYFLIPGQAEYGSRGDAEAGAASELRSLDLAGLPIAEYKFIATLVVQTGDGKTNTVKSSIEGADVNDAPFIDWRFQGSGQSGTQTSAATEGQMISVAVANLPSAAPAGRWRYVTDDVGGAVPCFSDGTDWRRCTDRAVASTT